MRKRIQWRCPHLQHRTLNLNEDMTNESKEENKKTTK